jgi:hypothetical protein
MLKIDLQISVLSLSLSRIYISMNVNALRRDSLSLVNCLILSNLNVPFSVCKGDMNKIWVFEIAVGTPRARYFSLN